MFTKMRLTPLPLMVVMGILASACGGGGSGGEKAKGLKPGGAENPVSDGNDPAADPNLPGGSSGSIVSSVDDATVTADDTALYLSSKLALIPPKDSGTAGVGLSLLNTSTSTAPESDYAKDKTDIFVREDSLSSLSQAESIMCFIGQTRFWEQVNAGRYLAIVDGSLCEEGKRNAGESNLMQMVVDSTREENRPIHAKGWVMNEGIHFDVKVAEGPNDANPLGIFRMSWSFYGESGDRMGGGMIDTSRNEAGNVILRFFQAEADRSNQSGAPIPEGATAILEFDANGQNTGGKVFSFSDRNDAECQGPDCQRPHAYEVAFNADRIKSVRLDENSSTQELCRDRSAFTSEVYQYGLYSASDRSRIELNSGFPIEITKNDGSVRHGHLGFWGMWIEGDMNFEQIANDVSKIERIDWSQGGTEPARTEYSILTAPGRLYKHTTEAITLAELQGVDLHYHEFTEQGESRYIVQWDGTSLRKLQSISQGERGEDEYTALSAEEQSFSFSNGSAHFWVPSLSAPINIFEADLDAEGGSLTLNYFTEKLVSGTSEVPNTDLLCFRDCPKIGITEQHVMSQNDDNAVYVTNEQGSRAAPNLSQALMTYSFDASTQNLTGGEGSFVFPIPSNINPHEAFSYPNAQPNFGILIPEGALNSISAGDLQNLDPFSLYGLVDTYYTWRSGVASWNRFTAAVDGNNNIVQFDAPIEFAYTHSAANDLDQRTAHPSFGKKFRLDYGGLGQLWGIPWQPNGQGREAPLFNIKAGTTVGPNNSYVVKPLAIAQIPVTLQGAGQCADLSMDGMPGRTTEADLIVINNGPQPTEISSIPTRMIAGEPVESGE